MLKKKFLKTKPVCEVTFQLPKDTEADKVCLVGEFNDWDPEANPLRKTRGVWKTKLKLETGREYQYRYLIDGADWLNDQEADKYVSNNIDGDNSVVETYKDE